MFKLFIVLAALVCSAQSQSEEYIKFVQKIDSDPVLHNDFDNNLKYLSSLDKNYINYKPDIDFPCDTSFLKDMEPARNVHELKPSDIKIVAAFGDSITAAAGAGAKTPLGLITEYRGMSWSIGGEGDFSKHVTIPNILKKFTSHLTGASIHSDSFPFLHTENLNVAVSGEKAQHIPAQARDLINKIKADKTINIENDWKLVTLFIGGNDLCQFCKDKIHLPETYIDNIKKGLDILHEELPRTLVNFVSMLNIKDIKDMNKGLICPELHLIECPCPAYPIFNRETQYDYFFEGYTNLSKALVESGRYDTKDDFTVVLQPFFTEFSAPRLPNGQVDLTFFAPDCFHFSQKSHGLAAIGLWNNMLQPVGKKSRSFSVDASLDCPTKEHPFIYTSKNSK